MHLVTLFLPVITVGCQQTGIVEVDTDTLTAVSLISVDTDSNSSNVADVASNKISRLQAKKRPCSPL